MKIALLTINLETEYDSWIKTRPVEPQDSASKLERIAFPVLLLRDGLTHYGRRKTGKPFTDLSGFCETSDVLSAVLEDDFVPSSGGVMREIDHGVATFEFWAV